MRGEVLAEMENSSERERKRDRNARDLHSNQDWVGRLISWREIGGKKRVRKAENGRGDDDTFTIAMFYRAARAN